LNCSTARRSKPFQQTAVFQWSVRQDVPPQVEVLQRLQVRDVGLEAVAGELVVDPRVVVLAEVGLDRDLHAGELLREPLRETVALVG